MTPRENLSLLVSGKRPAWIPFTLDVGGTDGLTAGFRRRFEAETGSPDPAEYFDYDFRIASLKRRFGGNAARSLLPDAPAGTEYDEWGIGHWAGGAEDTYERMFPPLAGAKEPSEIAAWPVPTLDAADASGAAEEARRFHARGYPVAGYAGSIYEWSWWLRGMEQFLVDLLERPDLAGALVARVAGFTTKLALETARAGIDVLAFYDDAGSQWGLQVSPEMWRSLIKPAWKKVLDAVRAEHPESVFFLHSCGNIEAIVPDIVEIGFHILHPIQPECMDPRAVKDRWGSRIVPCAAIGAQRTLPLCTAAEVRRETQRLIESMGSDRRCILCPSNRIQPETPWENVAAFAEAATRRRPGRQVSR